MKQKKIGTDLYVFDTSAYQLTKDLDVDNIYIQQELIPGYLTVNSSTGVQAKIKPYNYKLITAQKPVWGDYIYADDPKADLSVKFVDDNSHDLANPWLVDSRVTEALFGVEATGLEEFLPQYTVTTGSDVIEIAEKSATHGVVPQKLGNATIKAEWTEGDTYTAGSATQNIKVVPVFQIYDPTDSTHLLGEYLPGETVIIDNGYNDIPYKFAYFNTDADEDQVSITITFGNTDLIDAQEASGEKILYVTPAGETTMTISTNELPGGPWTWDVSIL